MSFRTAPFFDTERGKAALAATREKAERLSAAVALLPLPTEKRTYIAPAIIQSPCHHELPSESEDL